MSRRLTSRLEVLDGRRGRALYEAWLSASPPTGTEVLVTKDDGLEHPTRTRSAPWMVGRDCPVIMLEGMIGGYALSRVRLPSEPRRVHLAARGLERAGCDATLTRRDVLTADLERVTCARCLKALENLKIPRHHKTCDWSACGGCMERSAL